MKALTKTQTMRTEFPNNGFKQGYMSFWDGRRYYENPYTVGTDLRQQWAEGNIAAGVEHEELYGKGSA